MLPASTEVWYLLEKTGKGTSPPDLKAKMHFPPIINMAIREKNWWHHPIFSKSCLSGFVCPPLPTAWVSGQTLWFQLWQKTKPHSAEKLCSLCCPVFSIHNQKLIRLGRWGSGKHDESAALYRSDVHCCTESAILRHVHVTHIAQVINQTKDGRQGR